MADALVVDASSLIFLGRIGHLGLLPRVARRVLVPAVVIDETSAGAAVDPTAVASAGWARDFVIPSVGVPATIASWELGAGESQVLAVAASLAAAEAVLDDLAARRCANAIGLPVVGTLGLLLRAKRLGLIPAARPLVGRLLESGMFLTREFIDSALKEVGE